MRNSLFLNNRCLLGQMSTVASHIVMGFPTLFIILIKLTKLLSHPKEVTLQLKFSNCHIMQTISVRIPTALSEGKDTPPCFLILVVIPINLAVAMVSQPNFSLNRDLPTSR